MYRRIFLIKKITILPYAQSLSSFNNASMFIGSILSFLSNVFTFFSIGLDGVTELLVSKLFSTFTLMGCEILSGDNGMFVSCTTPGSSTKTLKKLINYY